MSDKQVEIERQRGDFFRNVLAEEYGCPARGLHPSCEHGDCPFVNDDGWVAYAECWDDVEEGQR